MNMTYKQQLLYKTTQAFCFPIACTACVNHDKRSSEDTKQSRASQQMTIHTYTDKVIWLNASGQRILTKGCITGGGYFTGDNITWHQPVRSIAVGCSSCAVMPLLRTELLLLLHILQQRLPMLFNRLKKPPKLLLPVGGSRPHLIHRSLGPWVSPQTASWSI